MEWTQQQGPDMHACFQFLGTIVWAWRRHIASVLKVMSLQQNLGKYKSTATQPLLQTQWENAPTKWMLLLSSSLT